MPIVMIIALLTFSLSGFTRAESHPGRTDKYGCHTCHTNCPRWGLNYGEYHCHNARGRTSNKTDQLLQASAADTEQNTATTAPYVTFEAVEIHKYAIDDQGTVRQQSMKYRAKFVVSEKFVLASAAPVERWDEGERQTDFWGFVHQADFKKNDFKYLLGFELERSGDKPPPSVQAIGYESFSYSGYQWLGASSISI